MQIQASPTCWTDKLVNFWTPGSTISTHSPHPSVSTYSLWLFNHKGNLVRSHLHRSPLQGSTSPCRPSRTVLHLGVSWWARQWEKFFKHMRGGQGVMFMSPNCLQCLFRNASSHVGIIPCHTHSDTCGIHCDHFEHMAGKIYCFHCSCFEVFGTACITCLAHPNATMGQSSVSEASSYASTVQHIGKVWHSKVPCFCVTPQKIEKWLRIIPTVITFLSFVIPVITVGLHNHYRYYSGILLFYLFGVAKPYIWSNDDLLVPVHFIAIWLVQMPCTFAVLLSVGRIGSFLKWWYPKIM